MWHLSCIIKWYHLHVILFWNLINSNSTKFFLLDLQSVVMIVASGVATPDLLRWVAQYAITFLNYFLSRMVSLSPLLGCNSGLQVRKWTCHWVLKVKCYELTDYYIVFFLSHLMPLLTNVAHLDAGAKRLIGWRFSKPFVQSDRKL
jgi:hypothetical protein